MPIIKSAKKRVKQTAVRQARNYNTRSAMRKAIRAVEEAVKAGNKAEAEKLLPAAYKIIDTADKKNVLQSNTAARRKSKLAHMVADADKKKAAPKATVKAKKEAPKKVEKLEEASEKAPEEETVEEKTEEKEA